MTLRLQNLSAMCLFYIRSGFKSFRKLSAFAGRILWIGGLWKTGLDRSSSDCGTFIDIDGNKMDTIK